MKRSAAVLAVWLAFTVPAWSLMKVVEQEATQVLRGGQAVSDVRFLALSDAGRLAANQMGSHLEALKEVKAAKLTKEELQVATSLIMATEIVGEGKRGEGASSVVWVRVKASLDTQTVDTRVHRILSDSQLRAQLKLVNERRSDLESKNRQWLAQFQNAKSDAERDSLEQALGSLAQQWEAEHSFQQAFAAAVAGDPAAAVQLSKATIHLDPKNIRLHHNLGLILFAIGQRDAAETIYRQIIIQEPSYGPVYNELGVIVDLRGQLAEAEALYRKAVDLQPTYSMAHYNLGTVLERSGQQAQAEERFRKALDLDPKNSRASYSLGLAAHKRGQVNEAERLYRKSIELDPTYGHPYLALGNIVFTRNQWDEAERLYRRAAELQPNDANAVFNLGNVMWQKQRWQDAGKFYEKALVLDPSMRSAKDALERLRQGGLY